MEIIKPIRTTQPPRQVLAKIFTSLDGELPIHGGWGYSQTYPCIIDKNDPIVIDKEAFNGVEIEYIFVEKRIYLELIVSKPEGQKFAGIEWNLREQNLIEDNGKYFDRLVFDITALREEDFTSLKEEFEASYSVNPDFDMTAHLEKRNQKMVRFESEYWFDITSFMK